VEAARAQRETRREPLTHLLSVYGVAGLTAYFGLLHVGQPRAGQTVVVSAAAGSVGVFVGQIARLKGCRVVGIAGGEQKCRWLKEELGFDAVIDYKAVDSLSAALKDAAPKGIDVYFDNVGGDILEACLFRMNQGGRIACCGAVSQYDGAPPRHGPRGIPGLIVTKRLTMKGFILYDFAEHRDAALAELQGWVSSGQLKVPEDVLEGLAAAPAGLIGLLAGENRGKRMVRVS
jgi:NADPH-dependent curcumin reductase CurA